MRITVIEHEAEAGLGYLTSWLGLPCDVVRPYLGESVPARPADALIVLGGEASAWDDAGYPWLPATRDLLRTAVVSGVPTWGICLGAQLMTLALGGAVERGTRGLEVGACPVTALPAAAGDALLSGLGTAAAIQYHQDAMTRLPEGAVLLMTSELYPHQAYRVGERAWAVQFHPEATPEIFASWTAASGRQELDASVKAAEPALVAAWKPVAERFAAVVRGQLSTAPPPSSAAS